MSELNTSDHEPGALLARAEAAEVFGGLGADAGKELHLDAAGVLVADAHVEEDARVALAARCLPGEISVTCRCTSLSVSVSVSLSLSVSLCLSLSLSVSVSLSRAPLARTLSLCIYAGDSRHTPCVP